MKIKLNPSGLFLVAREVHLTFVRLLGKGCLTTDHAFWLVPCEEGRKMAVRMDFWL